MTDGLGTKVIKHRWRMSADAFQRLAAAENSVQALQRPERRAKRSDRLGVAVSLAAAGAYAAVLNTGWLLVRCARVVERRRERRKVR